jgi:glycosyltransferase involved in cell wall biosynthesis
MRILIWQWGRFGAGPRTAVDFAAGLAALPDVTPLLSLSGHAEIMRADPAPSSDLTVDTYRGVIGYLGRVATAPFLLGRLGAALEALAPDIALCAMPGPLDLAMQTALRRAKIPCVVVVHDADPHPGDGYPLQMTLQRMLVRRADAVVVLSDHVAHRLAAQGLLGHRPPIRTMLPQPVFVGMAPVRAHGGPFRLLSFGRLLTYKGLDLLAEALALVLPGTPMVVRVVGQGPESRELAALRRLPGVTVENRWVPEAEIPRLLEWADGLVLSHREASQSGVASAALAARRFLVATRVGGLAEQAAGDPACILCDVDARSLAAGLRAVLTAPLPAGHRTVPLLEAGQFASALRDVRLLTRPR